MRYACLFFSLMFALCSSHAQEWQHEIHGSFPVFFTISDTQDGEQGSRIMSGFNPASLNITSSAPSQNGVNISATMQITSHLQGSQTQNSGLFESRVAEIEIKGDFGQLNIGKGFGIFNSHAIGDMASGKGVGHMPGDSGNGNFTADQGNATNGRIGTGYIYANFNPRIIYSHSMGNDTSYKIGLFNPEEPSNTNSAVETPLPRIEGQLTHRLAGHKIWAGFLYQKVDASVENYEYQAVDVGAHFSHGALGLRIAYTTSKGIGADGLYGFGGVSDANVDATQAYLETTYAIDDITYGISYGSGAQDAGTNLSGAIAKVENTLAMAFAHKKVSANLHLMLELQSYSSETNTVTTQEYNALSTGIQVDF